MTPPRRAAPAGNSPVDRQFVAGLELAVGRQHVLRDPDVVAGYAVDWTGRFRGSTAAVVRPGSVAEVAEVVSRCRERGVPVVPQGGNTGLVGGGVPLHGEVVMSLRRLTALDPVDAAAGQLTAGSGATVAAVAAAAAAAGWAYGVDFASRDSATIGGSAATNAGGLRVLRYGDTRAQVLGVEAVLGTGDVVSHLGGLRKDNTGYALAPLLCGSEGTLGVITALRLRLVPPAPARVVALLAFAGAEWAVQAALALHRQLPSLSAAELMVDDGMALVCRALGLPAPFSAAHRAYLLVEASGQADPTAELASGVDSIEGVEDAVVADDSVRGAALWRYREGHPDAIGTLGTPLKLDVTLPAAAITAFVEAVPGVVGSVVPGARTWLFGHVADGNVHVNVSGADPGDDRVDDAVLRLTSSYGGSISAEHGIGTAKRRWLHLNRSAQEIAAFRAVKAALDPDAVMNPYAVLPPAPGPTASAPQARAAAAKAADRSR